MTTLAVCVCIWLLLFVCCPRGCGLQDETSRMKSKHVLFFSHSCFKYRFRICHNARENVWKWSMQSQIVSNTARNHNLPSSFSLFFSVVPNRFKYRQNATFTVLVFKFSRRLPSSSCFLLVLVQTMYYFSYWSFKNRSKSVKGKL